MQIRVFSPDDTDVVIDLWEACGLTRPWNNARLDIERTLTVQPHLFLVGTIDDVLVASAMAGYDGHRGWVNYLAVAPAHQGRGLGRVLMSAVEASLAAMGCPKLNLQVRAENETAIAFYTALGYRVDNVVSLGKRLSED